MREELAALMRAVEKASPKQRRTLWVLAEHPRLLRAVDLLLDDLAEGLK